MATGLSSRMHSDTAAEPAPPATRLAAAAREERGSLSHREVRAPTPTHQQECCCRRWQHCATPPGRRGVELVTRGGGRSALVRCRVVAALLALLRRAGRSG